MHAVDPDKIFEGTIVIVAPHMDDETLACGGLISQLTHKERIHILYATDGTRSPAPIIPGDYVSSDLGEVRVKEAIAAMKFLGLHEENLHFLRLPEGQLRKNMATLKRLLWELIEAIKPNHIFIPFRYDRHLDHLTVNHVILEGQRQEKYRTQIMEYFVYHRWRLLIKKDIRSYIKPNCLLVLDISEVAYQKRIALDYYESQTKIYYPWQTRPILTSQLLDEECQNPEYFLFHSPSLPDAAVFTNAVLWIKVVHRIEPVVKDLKYLSGAFLKRVFDKYVHAAG
jgi:LmbE family N-acetylglucosaminyl deacetylase